MSRKFHYHLLKRPFTSGQAIRTTDFRDLSAAPSKDFGSCVMSLPDLFMTSSHDSGCCAGSQIHIYTIMHSAIIPTIPWHPSLRCTHKLSTGMFLPPSALLLLTHLILWNSIYPIGFFNIKTSFSNRNRDRRKENLSIYSFTHSFSISSTYMLWSQKY